ncbi:uncharacterized protein LOC104436688 [Eucalyptus grandis]|uniref:Uncharacterized protein n=4 Tax=Eucalyptus grandis TaxID=71139 RepID=A0ACC3LCY7_EUCGR|nr:uncharacterized protein LOC104436688 [Eucalyptus grandis]KAK3436625.1 hypothetical protein EUGRSUZ_C01174 [Eucalyptus grandis]
MASALLSTGLFVPLKNRGETGGFCLWNSRSSIHGELLSKANLVKREISSDARGRLVIASVLGRKVTRRETVVPDPDYRIPIVLLGMAGGLAYTNNLLPAAPVGLLGLLLLFQTTRVRFVFDDEALEVKVGEELQQSGENVFVGGKNRWKYSTFVNWELWWPNFPVLVYFKETQTKPEGQVHFFPVIFNGKQLYDVMVERAGPSKTSGPK